MYFSTIKNNKKIKKLKTVIYFTHKRTIWAGLASNGSILFHVVSVVAAQLTLDDQPTRWPTHVTGKWVLLLAGSSSQAIVQGPLFSPGASS